MTIDSLFIGMQVRHPLHGVGIVKGLTEKSAEVLFDVGTKLLDPESSDLSPDQPTASLQGLNLPLDRLIRDVATKVVEALGLESPDENVEELGRRWLGGILSLRPSDATLQSKDIEIEVFFHKIVMLRNNLRVLEQKVNSHAVLSDADKVELQQYVTRCYGTLTTFNVLFQHKEDQFHSGH